MSDITLGSSRQQVSSKQWLMVLVLFSFVAVGGGAMLGLFLSASMKPGSEKESEVAPAANASRTTMTVRELSPIITNLSSSEVWVRLHVAIIYEAGSIPTPEVLATDLSADILGFMQTLTIAQLSGASGLQHLREDLNDRAIIRSDGKIRELVIESLVVQ